MKIANYLSLAALAFMTAACSNDDNGLDQQPVDVNGEITITATIDAADGANTRALSGPDGENKIKSTWETTDEFAILYNNGTENTKSIATVKSINASTVTITFTIPATLANNTACTIVYPASAANEDNTGADVATALATQDGTIGNCPEVRVGTATINKDTHSLESVTQLAPQNAIFKFSVKNAAGDATIDVSPLVVTIGSQDYVITPASATSTIFAALPAVNNQTVSFSATGSDNNIITFSKDGVSFDKGKYYQSTLKMTAWKSGKFTINGSSSKVHFSKGNLRATTADGGTNWTWAFAANQWDYVGGRSSDGTEDQTGNNYINGNGTVSASGTVDLFGWVGENSSFAGAAQYGISNSSTNADYGNVLGENLKSDWGTLAITNGGNAENSGWRTLTSAEWTYLFNTRTASTINSTENARYAKAKVNGVQGVILFPDTYTHPSDVTAPTGINATGDAGWNGNTYDAEAWGKMEAAGCVFLPAAGYRSGSSVYYAGSYGYYWSGTSYDANYACHVKFNSDNLSPATGSNIRRTGLSVRLVRLAE